MPWRLIGLIIIFGIFLVFIAFNLGPGNKCDISFGFRTFSEVPVFLTAFSSFALGMLCALPFIISFRVKRKVKAGKEEAAQNAKKKGGKGEETAASGGGFSEGGPYGVN
ncbi:MAG: hypothetical protein LBS37_08670 [Treponema sp.]|jgi:uncharacterized integral membrane protein|nr:hypothetical protein [Treponema sp.]